MRKQLVILFTAMITAVAVAIFGASFLGAGPKTTQAQGLVEYAYLQIDSGILGNNGIYISDVSYSWLLPGGAIPDEGTCVPGTLTQDTDASGFEPPCSGTTIGGANLVGVLVVDGEARPPIIYRDTTPPVVTLISPSTPNVKAYESSSLYLEANAQDAFPVTVGWDLNLDGSIDAPNPTSVTIPGLNGHVTPCFIVIATDAAGNVSKVQVDVSVLNLPPSIDSFYTSPSQIAYGGTLQLTATTSDPGGDTRTAIVDWGDGQLEQVVVKTDGSIQTAHTYITAGALQVTLTVKDIGGLSVSQSRSVTVETPSQTIDNRLIPGTYADCVQYNLTDGECGSLEVKLDQTKYAYLNDRTSTPLILGAYLNEYVAVIPNATVVPCWLVATNLRDALILNGLVAPPD